MSEAETRTSKKAEKKGDSTDGAPASARGSSSARARKTPDRRRRVARSASRSTPASPGDALDRARGAFSALTGGWAMILVATLVTGILGLVLTLASGERWEATALVNVEGAAASTSGSDPDSLARANESLALSYAATLNSRAFMTRIAPTVGDGETSATELSSSVTATALVETGLIAIAVSDSTPEGAELRATEVVTAFTTAVRADETARLSTREDQLRAQIGQLDAALSQGPDAAAQAARTAAAQRLSEVLLAQAEVGDTVALVAPPDATDGQVAPRPVFNLIVALILGAIIGAGLTWLGRRIDAAGGREGAGNAQ